MFCTPQIPEDHTRSVSDFFMPADKRESAVAWARGVLADIKDYRDETVIRACKVIEANDKDFVTTAISLRKFLEDCAGGTRHA